MIERIAALLMWMGLGSSVAGSVLADFCGEAPGSGMIAIVLWSVFGGIFMFVVGLGLAILVSDDAEHDARRRQLSQ